MLKKQTDSVFVVRSLFSGWPCAGQRRASVFDATMQLRNTPATTTAVYLPSRPCEHGWFEQNVAHPYPLYTHAQVVADFDVAEEV